MSAKEASMSLRSTLPSTRRPSTPEPRSRVVIISLGRFRGLHRVTTREAAPNDEVSGAWACWTLKNAWIHAGPASPANGVERGAGATGDEAKGGTVIAGLRPHHPERHRMNLEPEPALGPDRRIPLGERLNLLQTFKLHHARA